MAAGYTFNVQLRPSSQKNKNKMLLESAVYAIILASTLLSELVPANSALRTKRRGEYGGAFLRFVTARRRPLPCFLKISSVEEQDCSATHSSCNPFSF
jgi:hypothetical protein